MIDRIRAFFVVVEEGSVNRAATRLRLSQPALSRQIKALEDEIGGRLLDREPTGVVPTSLGHACLKTMAPVVTSYDKGLSEIRTVARGLRSELKIGYLMSAGQAILNPALERLREAQPAIKFKLLDMSPKEQIDALRAGEIDVALIGQEGEVASREFYSTKLKTLGVCVAVATGDPLSKCDSVEIIELKGRDFIGFDEAHMPGRNQWITGICKSKKFKPRFVEVTDGITHVLSQVASETAITMLPDYFIDFKHPGVTFIPVLDTVARWDFIVLWQRGSVPDNTKALIEVLSARGR